MKKMWLVLLFISLMICLSIPASADTENVTMERGLTFKGPYDILASLGIENVPTLSTPQIYVYYNFIAIGILFFCSAIAGQRNARFFAVLVPASAAMFAWFGWLHVVRSVDGVLTVDPASSIKVWSVVVMCVCLGVAIYMKGTLHEKFGLAGPGSLLLTFVFYIILLQTVVGMVNGLGIWGGSSALSTAPCGAGMSPDQCNYQNVDLTKEVTQLSEMGGLLGTVTAAGSALVDMAFMAGRIFIDWLITVGTFSVKLAQIYPWIPAAAGGLIFLTGLQVAIWISYGLTVWQIFFKPPAEGGWF